MEYLLKQRIKSAESALEEKRRFREVFQAPRDENRAEYRGYDRPVYPLVECTQPLGTCEGQTVPVKNSVMLPGQLFRDEKGSLIDMQTKLSSILPW